MQVVLRVQWQRAVQLRPCQAPPAWFAPVRSPARQGEQRCEGTRRPAVQGQCDVVRCVSTACRVTPSSQARARASTPSRLGSTSSGSVPREAGDCLRLVQHETFVGVIPLACWRVTDAVLTSCSSCHHGDCSLPQLGEINILPRINGSPQLTSTIIDCNHHIN